MQQAQRLAEGRVPRTSRYCPLELFSGDARRAARTLLHLIQEPQNHFRAFRDGVPEASLLPGGLGGQWWPLGARSMAESVLGGGASRGAGGGGEASPSAGGDSHGKRGPGADPA